MRFWNVNVAFRPFATCRDISISQLPGAFRDTILFTAGSTSLVLSFYVQLRSVGTHNSVGIGWWCFDTRLLTNYLTDSGGASLDLAMTS